jgi:iron complex transport system ATP-binding protein
MSGGELQMVLIARALTISPSMLVLDEPESNLDFKNQLIILETIQKLSRMRGISAVVNTHYPEHALKISDKALILNRDGSNIFGEASEIINEENMRKSFSVQVYIDRFDFRGNEYKSVVPIHLV